MHINRCKYVCEYVCIYIYGERVRDRQRKSEKSDNRGTSVSANIVRLFNPLCIKN